MNELFSNLEYKNWLTELKAKIKQSQIKAALTVNSQLIMLYWELGKQIIEKQMNTQWGSGFLEHLSKDLKLEFPSMGGFSKRNLELIRQWFIFYSNEDLIAKQLVSQLPLIPWGHHIKILQKSNAPGEAQFYILQTIENNWSRAVLEYQIESNLYARQGKAINEMVKMDTDNATIGILLCKNKDNFEVEFALKDVNKPIGVSEYKYMELPEDVQKALPSPVELNNELKIIDKG